MSATDDAEIRNLLARIAQTADTGTLEEYLANFTAGAVWEMPDNAALGLPASIRTGHDEIRAGVVERRAAGLQGPGTATRHVIATVAVSIEGAGRASARSYFLYYGETASAPALRSMGQYDDELHKGAAGWQLARRVITMG